MRRRQFLSTLGLGGLYLGASPWIRPSAARAQVPTNDRTVIVNITLRGGPDFRHMIAPPFAGESSGYGYGYWSNRWQSHGIGQDPAEWQQRWEEHFTPVEAGGQTFGFLDQAGWLADWFAAGNVAIVNNVAAATSRNHAHAEIVYESGDRNAGPGEHTRDGWGGRLAQVVGGKVVSMSSPVRLFCNGAHPDDPRLHDNSHVITASNTRDIALYAPRALDENPASTGTQAILSRGLSSYYEALRADVARDSTFAPFVGHEETFRSFGEAVTARLDTVPLPSAIESFYDGGDRLADQHFGRQLRNLYDSFACSDLFDFRVGSLYYTGFDSHRDQLSTVEPKFNDLFGVGRGLDTFFRELELAMPDAVDNLVLVVGGEFGRQIAANGDQGTDHGRGNTVLVIGRPVNGGVYGELFPDSEVDRFSGEPSADIDGKTSIDRVFSTVCDWFDDGVGSTVFPNQVESEVEEGVALEDLMSG